MAKTKNYNWPTPNPAGIQISEMTAVVEALSAIDSTFKSFEQAYTTHTHAFADLTAKPTTLSGYGITDAPTKDETNVLLAQQRFMLSNRDFKDGTLIDTGITYTGSQPFLVEIKGNSYGAGVPIDLRIQGYLYQNDIIQYSGASLGTPITGVVIFMMAGRLHVWFPRQAYWQGFSVYSTIVNPDGIAPSMVGINLTRTIRDIAKPISGVTAEKVVKFQSIAWESALDTRLRVDEAQSFTLAQKAQGRANIDALGTADRGAAGGVAPLGADSKVPRSYLPALDFLPLAGGTMTGSLINTSGSIIVRSAANAHIWFMNADGTERAVIWSDPATLDLHVRTNGKASTFKANGDFAANGSISANGNFTLGSRVAASTVDLSKHISLYGGVYGFNVTGSSLNVVNPTGANAYFRTTDGVENFRVESNGNVVARGNLYTGNGSGVLIPNGDILGSRWGGGWLYDWIERRAREYADDRKNGCVIDTRFAGFVTYKVARGGEWHAPGGYVFTWVFREDSDQYHFGARQPQIYIPAIGWRALGSW